MTYQSQRLTVKDLVLIGILSIVIRVLTMIAALPLMPIMAISYPFMAGVCVLVTAPVYLLMASKVNKRGVMLLFCAVMGLSYILMGYVYMLPYMLVAGIICELIMRKPNSYRSFKKNAIAYSIYSVLYCFAGFLPIYLIGDAFFENSGYSQKIIDIYLRYTYSAPWTVSILIITTGMAAIGCWIGNKMLKKHFVKSGIITK